MSHTSKLASFLMSSTCLVMLTATTATTATIEVTKAFFGKVNNADKIIIGFTLKTTGNGTGAVKIYSDYRISFTAALVVKPDIDLNNN